MVILTAAALTAAGVGAYQGGKAAVADVNKRMLRRNMVQTRKAERQGEEAVREEARRKKEVEQQNMTVDDRVARFKKGIPSDSGKKAGLFRKNPST